MLVIGPLVGIIGLLVANTLQSGRLINDVQYDEVFSTSARNKMTVQSLISDLQTKRDFTQLFLRCPAPTISECTGPYDGHLLNLGICAPLSKFISNRLFGPGIWAGKELNVPSGVNLFFVVNKGAPEIESTIASKRFACLAEKSALDSKPVLCLDYAPFNRFDPIAWGMRDEIRKVNDNLFIGCGGLAISGGVHNFAPFALVPSTKN